MRCRATVDCTAEALYGVVESVEFTSAEVVTSMLVLVPTCPAHTADTVGATRASVGPDEFTVVHLMHAAGDPGRLS